MVREREETIGGRRVRWLDAGPESGRVLVWLHAFPLSAAMWLPQLEAPPPGWRLIAPDLAGFGGTADHDGAPHIDDFADDLDRLLAHLDAPPIVLGGLSMGGYAAFAMMRRHPARVRALILADTRSAADSPEARANRARLLSVVRESGPAGVADQMLPTLVGETTRRERPEVVARVRALIEANAAAGIARGIERLRDRPDSTPLLSDIAIPALVVSGAEDAITRPDDARALAAALPRGTVAIVPAAGHLSNLEHPRAFDAAVGGWLSEV
ncbi:MAG TPA: alpha/beta fold hydrolase [Vicinamibacterales bacterium]